MIDTTTNTIANLPKLSLPRGTGALLPEDYTHWNGNSFQYYLGVAAQITPETLEQINVRSSAAAMTWEIYRQAIVENDHHDALMINNAPHLSITEEIAVRDIEQMEQEIARLRAANARLSQWDSGHPAWDTFWDAAAEAADTAGWCDEYDKLAESLGGPRRTRDYLVSGFATIEVRVPVSTLISAASEDKAMEIAEANDYLDVYSSDDIIYAVCNGAWTEETLDMTEAEQYNS